MKYETFSILEFRPLLKKSFHCIHIDLRDTFGEKKPFVSVGITCIILMFRRVSNILIRQKHIRLYKMVASRQAEMPY